MEQLVLGLFKFMNCEPIGFISNSQNGMVYYPMGISSCICSGGNGHDATYPYIAEIYYI